MAGIDVAVGDDGEVLVARAARRDALLKAGTAFEVDMEMKEGKALPLRLAADILVAQLFILRFDDGQVLFWICRSGISVTTGSTDRESNP